MSITASIMFHRNDVVYSDIIPESVLELATEKHTELIKQLAEIDHAIDELILNDKIPNNDDISAAIQWCTIDLKFSPVFLNSAIKKHCDSTSSRWCMRIFSRSFRIRGVGP